MLKLSVCAPASSTAGEGAVVGRHRVYDRQPGPSRLSSTTASSPACDASGSVWTLPRAALAVPAPTPPASFPVPPSLMPSPPSSRTSSPSSEDGVLLAMVVRFMPTKHVLLFHPASDILMGLGTVLLLFYHILDILVQGKSSRTKGMAYNQNHQVLSIGLMIGMLSCALRPRIYSFLMMLCAFLLHQPLWMWPCISNR